MGNNSNNLLKLFINRFNTAKTKNELLQLVEDIKEFLKNNPNEENLKVLLVDIYTLIEENQKINSILESIDINKLDEEFKIAYLVFLFDTGNFEKLINIIENPEIYNLNFKKPENLITLKLIYISVAIEYYKIPLIEEEIKDIYKTIFKREFSTNEFLNNFDNFLSATIAVSKLENIEYLLYKVYLYFKAKDILGDKYRKALKIVEDILIDISSKYLTYFIVSPDEVNLILVLVLDDLVFESLEEFLEFRENIEVGIKDKFKGNLSTFPKFTISIPNPNIDEYRGV